VKWSNLSRAIGQTRSRDSTREQGRLRGSRNEREGERKRGRRRRVRERETERGMEGIVPSFRLSWMGCAHSDRSSK
jgi:hypothetical protein